MIGLSTAGIEVLRAHRAPGCPAAPRKIALPSGRLHKDASGMDLSASSDSSVLPGTAVLALCVLILLAGYAAAAARTGGSVAIAAAQY